MIDRIAMAIGALRGLARPRAQPRAGEDDQDGGIDPRRRDLPRDPRAELVVAALLAAAGLAAGAFAVLLALDAGTRALGLTLGGALASLAAALTIAARRVVPREVDVQRREPMGDARAREAVTGEICSAADGISRRRLLAGAAGLAGGGLAAAVVVPAASLGPGAGALERSPWRRGTLLVNAEGRGLTPADVPMGGMETAYPEGADPRELGAPVVLVHLDPATIELPPERRDWVHDGIVAYSKVCTHAGCAISMLRSPVSPATSQPPALVCPCHYSTFDPARGARPVFGPAVRALPQLPIHVDAAGRLRAGGGFSASVGPSWWRVRRT